MNADLIPIPYHLKLKMLILITEFGYFFFRVAVHRSVLSLLLILPLSPNPLIVPTKATSLELSSLYNHKQYLELCAWKDLAFIQRITFIFLKNITHFISGNYLRK